MPPKPQSIILHPEVERFREKEYVSIAAGFVCSDGIVIAADTKESYGETHTYAYKISEVQHAFGSGAIAGSGEGYLLDYIVPKIEKLLDSRWLNIEALEAQLVKIMTDIYESDAVKSYPIEKPSDLYTQLLFAVSISKREMALFLINSTLVTRVLDGAQIIGCGPMRQMADEMGGMDLTVQQASIAALYLVYEAKRRYGDVGGVTQIYRLSDGQAESERTWGQASREALFDSLRHLHHVLLVETADPKLSRREYLGAIKRVVDAARQIHAAFVDIENKYEKWKPTTLLKLLGAPPIRRARGKRKE